MANTYTYTNSNITFSLPEFDASRMKKYNQKHIYANDYEQAAAGNQPIKQFINAVEIDWNHAYVGTTYLDTTGESGCSILVPSNC